MKYSNTEIGALADSFKKSIKTIERWIAAGDDRLTSERAKETLRACKEAKNANK